MDMSESGIPWKWILIGAAVIIVALIIRCATTPESEPAVEMAVVCADCGYTGVMVVGNTPSLEPWPRTCPSCGKETLYLAGRRCKFCKKVVPLKDPQADRYGVPEQCPWCKKGYSE